MTPAQIRVTLAEVLSAVLFVWNANTLFKMEHYHWSALALPTLLLALLVINLFWFTRFVAWVIFGSAFFALLVMLSAFTIRWRLENGFQPWPFYRAMGMYAAFIYASLGQIHLWNKQHPLT